MAAPVTSMDAVMSAIVKGNLPMLKEMASTMDLRRLRGIHGENLLHLAVRGSCMTGQLDVCRCLVEEKGFDANATSMEGETPIFVATDTQWFVNGFEAPGVVPLLTYFLDRGVDPATPDARGCTALLNAAEYGHKEAIELLLSKGIPVDPLNHNGTPLHLAAARGNALSLKILLDHGADPNKVVNRVYCPLLMACTRGSLECVKLLVEAGADVNFQHSPTGPTMLLAAVSVGSAEIVKFLLAAGADPNIHDEYGKFPIMQAAVYGQYELVEILLRRTNPISFMSDWSVDGVIGTMRALPRELYVEPIGHAKSEGKKAFANREYGYAICCFSRAWGIDPRDATVPANLSLCWLKLREGRLAALRAQECQRLCPRWAKAWFREGAALSLLQKYKAAVDAFEQALKLDPGSEEIKEALREARKAALSRELAYAVMQE